MSSKVEDPPFTKKRKLRHPRTARACDFCRKRKTRCSGQLPSCSLCIEHEVECCYNEDPPSRRQTSIVSVPPLDVPDRVVSSLESSLETISRSQPPPTRLDVVGTSASVSRRASLEPEATFDNGQHVGPTSGVAFLYKWQEQGTEPPRHLQQASALSSYGDVPLPQVPKAAYPAVEEGKHLLDHFFRFAMPTFRFFHQQTLERWMTDLLERRPLESGKAASVLIVWTHSLMYSEKAPSSAFQISARSLSYLEQAQALLDEEAGPASVASVEARLTMCLVLLAIAHVNECRFLFGSTYTLVIVLGLHRKTPKRVKLSLLECERRKRVFWSFYAIDGYLSVMLGQPRQLRDEDIDQEYPENIEDLVLDTATDLAQCPRHGSVEASISHAKLARIFARSNELLYPIIHLSTEEILLRSEQMVDSIEDLEKGLPQFLLPRISAATGQQTWDRQNNVLSLAFGHARIIASRRAILISGRIDALDQESRQRLQKCIRVCLQAVYDVLERASLMYQNGRLLWGFWLTQYVTTCALSTLLVFRIQSSRGKISSVANLDRFSEYYEKADEIRKHLAAIAPEGSQSQRHHLLLARLKRQADRSQTSTSAPRSNVLPAHTPVHNEHANANNEEESASTTLPDMFFNDSGTTPPYNMFDLAFEDSSSWQYLDQLGTGDLDTSLLWPYD